MLRFTEIFENTVFVEQIIVSPQVSTVEKCIYYFMPFAVDIFLQLYQ